MFAVGVFWNHPIDFLIRVGNNTCRLVGIFFSMIKINITPRNEMIFIIVDIAFSYLAFVTRLRKPDPNLTLSGIQLQGEITGNRIRDILVLNEGKPNR